MEEDYTPHCLELQVVFPQANSSSLDIIVLADIDSKVADIN